MKYSFYHNHNSNDHTIAETVSPPALMTFYLNSDVIDPLLNTSNNIMNLLVHENYHAYGDLPSGPNSSPEHLNAYLAQVQDKSWSGTTDEWKEVHYGAIYIYINRAKGKEKQEWTSKFEQALNGKIKKDKNGKFYLEQNK